MIITDTPVDIPLLRKHFLQCPQDEPFYQAFIEEIALSCSKDRTNLLDADILQFYDSLGQRSNGFREHTYFQATRTFTTLGTTTWGVLKEVNLGQARILERYLKEKRLLERRKERDLYPLPNVTKEETKVFEQAVITRVWPPNLGPRFNNVIDIGHVVGIFEPSPNRQLLIYSARALSTEKPFVEQCEGPLHIHDHPDTVQSLWLPLEELVSYQPLVPLRL
ncbi:MAG TPA: hypothetical protein VJB87_01805 [Candidatus Nanoarchaeia archaeon]|nr:hypothetical protein [Candidatus Nanoarchaeia archaeon]